MIYDKGITFEKVKAVEIDAKLALYGETRGYREDVKNVNVLSRKLSRNWKGFQKVFKAEKSWSVRQNCNLYTLRPYHRQRPREVVREEKAAKERVQMSNQQLEMKRLEQILDYRRRFGIRVLTGLASDYLLEKKLKRLKEGVIGLT